MTLNFRKGTTGNMTSLAVWSSVGALGADNSGASIQARMIDSNALPVGDQFVVNDVMAGSQFRLFDANAIPKGAQFQVNESTDGFQVLPDVAMDDSGDFIVVWQDDDPVNGSLIFGQCSTPMAPRSVATFC